MNGLSIGVGLFLLFALWFVGGIGHSFSTNSGTAAALLLVLAGILSLIKGKQSNGYWPYIMAGIAYLPMIVLRLSLGFIDIAGLIFDSFIVWFIFTMVQKSKPNKSNKAQPPAAGAQ